MNEDFSGYLNKISSGKKLILIGEIHGTKEIPTLLNDFFSEYIKENDFDIHLELSSDEQSKINAFLESGDEIFLRNTFFNIADNDGRRTLEYLELIKKIFVLNKKHNKAIRIFCVDVADSININSENLQNEREKIIADNILKNTTKKTFVILGSVHVANKIINISGIKIIPSGYYLYKKIKDAVNINLVPKKGKFINVSLKQVDSSLKDFNQYYDYIYYLDCVSPATIL